MDFKWDLLRWWRTRFVRKKLPVPRANLSRPTLQLAHGQHKARPTALQANNQLSLLPGAFSKKDARADQSARFPVLTHATGGDVEREGVLLDVHFDAREAQTRHAGPRWLRRRGLLVVGDVELFGDVELSEEEDSHKS